MERSKSSVSLWKLYRYANCLDTVLILLATCCATLSGVCLPLLFVINGSAFTQFANYAIAIKLKDKNMSGADYFCNDSNLHEYLNSRDPADMLLSEIPTYTYYTLSLSLVYFLSVSLSRFLWSVSATRQGRRMRLAYLKSVLTRHIGWFDMNSSAELHTHLSYGIQTIETGIGYSMSNTIQECATFLSAFVIAFSVSWEASLVTYSILPVSFIALYIAQKVSTRVVAKQQGALAMAGSVAEEVLSSIKTVKAFSGQNKETERYNLHLKQLKWESYKIVIIKAVLLGVLFLMGIQYYPIGYRYGIQLFVECSITTGEVLIIMSEIAVGTFAVSDILPCLGDVSAAIGSASVIYGIIDTESEINPTSDVGIVPETFEGSILFSDVQFSYPSRPDVKILHGLELSVKPGQTVAFVGPSGCGKSTVTKLLARIYECTAGSIILDGIDIIDLNINWLRNQIGVVSQEPVLFNVSVAENISYGKESASMHDIVMAAKVANAHKFISDLPDGYNTVVGEGGAQLSGGQKQRIAIARVLVRDPKILLLDEATSALDTESEKYVQEALNKAKEGRTTIIIAHRLSTIQTADMIIGIDKGLVVEMGRHEELMKNEGLYYQLVMNQTMEEKSKDLVLATINKQKPLSSGDVMKLSQYNGTDYNDVLKSDTELRDLTEEATEESPLLQAEVSLAHPYRIGTFAVLKEVSILCFHKVQWFFLIVGVILFTVFGMAFSLTVIFFLGVTKSLSQIDSDKLISTANVYTVLMALWGIAFSLIGAASVFSFGICEHELNEKIRQISFKALLNKHINWFDQPENPVSILSHKLAVEASNISHIVSMHMGLSIRSGFTVIVAVILSFVLAWPIALVVTLTFPLMILGAYLQVTFTKRYADDRNKLIEDTAKVAVESIENVFTVATLGIENRLVNKYNQLLEQPFRYSLKSAAINGVISGFSKSILTFTISIAYIVGGYLCTSDESEVYYADYAEISTAMTAVIFTSVMCRDQFDVLPDAQNAILSAKGFVMKSKEPSMDAYNEYGIIPKEIKGGLKTQKVEFTYPARPGVTVLKSFSISVVPGHTLALVGPSGSGKSSVISLIERFYDPTAGSILFDGNDIRELNISWYRHQIGLVSQEPVLFNISIGDNIRYGADFRDVSDEEVIKAAKSANIDEFIQSLPEGYNTIVGMKGTQLSGGQKQRVAIARALIRDPKILLLDEATSALDTESEKVVQEALDKAREGRTTIIVAHRLSTIYNSDNIAVLYNGQVIEQGTHSELMGQHGTYYLMNNVQKLD